MNSFMHQHQLPHMCCSQEQSIIREQKTVFKSEGLFVYSLKLKEMTFSGQKYILLLFFFQPMMNTVTFGEIGGNNLFKYISISHNNLEVFYSLLNRQYVHILKKQKIIYSKKKKKFFLPTLFPSCQIFFHTGNQCTSFLSYFSFSVVNGILYAFFYVLLCDIFTLVYTLSLQSFFFSLLFLRFISFFCMYVVYFIFICFDTVEFIF